MTTQNQHYLWQAHCVGWQGRVQVGYLVRLTFSIAITTHVTTSSSLALPLRFYCCLCPAARFNCIWCIGYLLCPSVHNFIWRLQEDGLPEWSLGLNCIYGDTAWTQTQISGPTKFSVLLLSCEACRIIFLSPSQLHFSLLWISGLCSNSSHELQNKEMWDERTSHKYVSSLGQSDERLLTSKAVSSHTREHQSLGN